MTTDPQSGRRPIPARNLTVVKRIAGALARGGVTPNQISLFGLLVGLGSGLALWLTALVPDHARLLWIVSAAMVLARGTSNMLDGMVAVEHGQAGATGLFYNEVPDRVSDVALMVGAGYSLGGSPAAGWAAACVALFVAYVRAIGTLAGAPADFGGPMAKQQRMFLLAAVSAWLAVTPAAWRFPWGSDGALGLTAAALWVIVAGGVLTAVLRLRRAARAVESRPVRA
jgi:phosphatidylglycerophosphate synthase